VKGQKSRKRCQLASIDRNGYKTYSQIFLGGYCDVVWDGIQEIRGTGGGWPVVHSWWPFGLFGGGRSDGGGWNWNVEVKYSVIQASLQPVAEVSG
jgi:hypothetical protein